MQLHSQKVLPILMERRVSMDIRTLQYFLAIAKEESITKAAESLNMTQPPLSRQMKDLEQELGKQLFIRGSKKIALTEDGKLLRKRAEELVALMDKTVIELTSNNAKITGDILIAAGETENIAYLANIAKALGEKYPEIHYHLFSGDSNYVKDRLDNGLVDFGLVIGTVDISKYEYIKLPVSDSWGVIMQRSSELAAFDSIRSEQLQNKPILMSYQSATNSDILDWLEKGDPNPNVIATYNLAYNASVFVKQGFGYMLCLDNILDTSPESGLIFRPVSPPMQADMFIIWKKHQMFGKAAGAFLDAIKESTRS